MGPLKSLYIEGLSHSSPIPAAKIGGNLLFSGLIGGTDPATRSMPASLEQQAANMFAQVQAVMQAAGGTCDQILKVTIWLNDRKDRELINPAWERLFPDRNVRPARVTLNRDLGGGKLVECEIVALLA
jgi:2-iminobutanoate/2-iminopropanoate deaminase